MLLQKWLTKIGTALIAIATLFGLMKMKEASDKKAGKKEQELDDIKEVIEEIKEAKEIENNIDKLDPDDKRKRLRNFFKK